MNRIPFNRESIDSLLSVVDHYGLTRYSEVLGRLKDKIETATDEEFEFLDTLFQEIILEVGIETLE
ncbi:MAG: hypothetical protein ACRDCE_01450 [Cetobacterium sp.]|uniref:hypothetical protein n=1 Tax=Cetobacterium sp. TaxID=2071632 RepID=UPI003EE80A03